MKRYLYLYKKFLAQYLKILMEYKVDFLIGLLGFFITQISGIIFIYIIFESIPSLNGWNFYQIVFIYGFSQLPRGLDHLLTDNLWHLAGSFVVDGKFDKYLLRPINPLFHMLAELFQPDAFGELIVGVILTVTASIKLDLHFGILNILLFILVIILGAIIYFSIKLFLASLAFWVKFSMPLVSLGYSFGDFAKYPMSIYSKFIQFFLSFIIPFAFTAYFPAAYFVGKIDLGYAIGVTIIVTGISFIIAYATWSNGVKAYESAGN